MIRNQFGSSSKAASTPRPVSEPAFRAEAMGQAYSAMSLTDRASSRALSEKSTLQELCGDCPYVVQNENAEDMAAWSMTVDMAAASMRRLGFVVVKNIFSDKELGEIEPTVDAMAKDIFEKSGGSPAWGNRGPNRQSANFERQPAGGIMWRNTKLQAVLQEVLQGPCHYGGTSADIAFPGTVYQGLHSDDNGSKPCDSWRQEDVRHRKFPPAFLLAGPILNDWTAANGPMRIVPWTAVTDLEYKLWTRNGISYNDEKTKGFIDAYIEAKRGDVLVRDPRVLHGGTPNKTETARPMIAISVSSHEAHQAYPDFYQSLEVPKDQESFWHLWASLAEVEQGEV
jgi:hypothetical protein